MEIRKFYSKGILFIVLTLLFACSTASVDINNEDKVLKDIQGDWVGFVDVANMYRHFKLSINDNSFKAWVQMSDGTEEPEWTELPGEKGLLSLSSILEDTEKKLNYRKFVFTCAGRCCRDKSIAIEALTQLLTYVEGKGLTLRGDVKMARK